MRYAILHATIVGPIWMPSVVCSKHTTARIERSDAETFAHGGPYPSLREALLHVTNDGDFQACGLAPGSWLEVIDETPSEFGTTLKRRTRVHELAFATWATDDMRAKDEWLDAADASWDFNDD